MKGVTPPVIDRTIIVVKDGDGWELRTWNRFMGDRPIGLRLARRDDLPDLPTKASTYSNADQLRQRWQAWLDKQDIKGRRRNKK